MPSINFLILWRYFLHHMQFYLTTHTKLIRKSQRDSTFTWANSNVNWNIRHSILHWAWKLRSDIFIALNCNSTLTCICQFLPITILRVSNAVWYWLDPDLDPNSQDKTDLDPDTSVLKNFHLFYEDFFTVLSHHF